MIMTAVIVNSNKSKTMQNKDIDKIDVYLVKRTNNEYGDIYIMSKWPKSGANENQKYEIEFVLQTSIDGNCFCGELKIDDMQCTATELNIPYSLLKSECHLALSADERSDTLSLYKFVLERNPNENVFTLWKKQSKVLIQYFVVKLREKLDNSDMLDVLVALVQKMPQTTVMPIVHTATTLQKTKLSQGMDAALIECADAQKKLERELMSKFCFLLNTKKQKINNLQDKLKELTANEKTTTSTTLSVFRYNKNEAIENNDVDFDAGTQQMTI